MRPEWLLVTADDLRFEREQLREEGRDVGPLEAEFAELIDALDPEGRGPTPVEDRVDVVDAVAATDAAVENRDRVNALLDDARNLSWREDYPWHEPNELTVIRSSRPLERPRWKTAPTGETLEDHLYGAWLGRCAGCLLGKPVEGWTTEKTWAVLRAQDNFPLERYVEADLPESVAAEHGVDPEGVFRSALGPDDAGMPEDDDTNYTVAGLDLLVTHGLGFDSGDVARNWMRNVPMLRTHTAERVAYRNFATLVEPPESARHRNPYREWIGAMIRADPYGYVAVGDPALAAELAWRDARVSHVKNGIYGAMWVAAMLAAAPAVETPRELLRAGLAEIPERSRLTSAVADVLGWREEGIEYDEALERLHDRWDQTNYHHWCHTISNAEIVCIGLLWGEGELGPSICRTVQAGFDTDSSGATVGSLVGMLVGADALPGEWVDPLEDTIESGIDGYARVAISDLAATTAELAGSRERDAAGS
jgi:ADP-ribosylglycohydrolase